MIDKDDQNKNYGLGDQNNPSKNPDSDYGLPEAKYSPIEREQPLKMDENVSYHSSQPEENDAHQNRSNWPLWLALGLIVCLSAVFIYFLVFDDGDNSEQLTQEPVEEFTPIVAEEEPEPAETPSDEEWEPAEPEVVEGSVSSVTSRTGRYYMIVGSFIDNDLANDYGQKLTKEGISSKIIEPAGTRKFYRLSVKDAENIDDLQMELDSMRSKFGENVWIVKY